MRLDSGVEVGGEVESMFIVFIFCVFFFFSSRRRHTRLQGDWSSDVCSSDLTAHSRENHSMQKQGTNAQRFSVVQVAG